MDCEERIMLSASRSLEGLGLRLGRLYADDLAAGEVQGGVARGERPPGFPVAALGRELEEQQHLMM